MAVSNPYKFDDPKAQELSDRWWQLTPSKKQIESVGRAYMIHILGVSEETIEAFLSGDSQAYHEVGMKQSSIPFKNGKAFWKAVKKTFPKLLSRADFQFLIKKCDVYAVLTFLNTIQPPARETTKMFRMLGENAHVYK